MWRNFCIFAFDMNYESLVGRINLIQDALQAQAAHAVNLSLTARNWLVGYYIVEFEQHGEDRAKYGEKLLNRLSKSINRKGFAPRRLREFRQFYLVYPSLGVEVSNYIKSNHVFLLEPDEPSIWRMPSAKLQLPDNQENEKWRMPSAKLEEWSTPTAKLFNRLNYSCLLYLSGIDDPLKRERYSMLLRVCRRICLLASIAYNCPLKMTSANTCWRISQRRSSES